MKVIFPIKVDYLKVEIQILYALFWKNKFLPFAVNCNYGLLNVLNITIQCKGCCLFQSLHAIYIPSYIFGFLLSIINFVYYLFLQGKEKL